MTTLADALSYSALGWCVIPMKMATKRPAVRWKRFQTLRPDDKQLRKWFDHEHDYGLAVIFGDVSGGLANRDFDDLETYQRWSVEHPDLAKTLPTVETRRGRHVYCRFAADDVAAFRRLIGKPDGIGAIHCDGGELRIGVGCYSVIPNSQHPSGFVYRWLVSPFDRPMPLLTISESGFFAHATEMTEKTESTEKTEAIRGKVGGVPVPKIQTPESEPELRPELRHAAVTSLSRGIATDVKPAEAANAIGLAIRSTLPTCPGERNKLVFGLARALKAIPGLIDAGLDRLQPLVRQWHNLAKPNIGTPAFEETWLDFIHAWPRVKFPGKEPMAMILATAVALEPPEAVRHYESEPLKLLASLCRELQRATGDAPFFLSVRTVGKYFNVDPATASRWLTLLRVDHVIDEVEKGTQKTGRASRFRYRGNLAAEMKRKAEHEPELQCSMTGDCEKPSQTSGQPSIFAKLERDDLRDDATLASWFKAATSRKQPVVTDCFSDWLNVFAAAERALELGTNPGALFAYIVGEHQWHLISNEQEDRARHRLRRLRNPERESERQRRHDDDDSTGEISEPLFAGDIAREFVNKLFPPTNPNPSETIHA